MTNKSRDIREYTKEFKEQAVRLVLEDGSKISNTARALGIAPSTLHGWMRQHRLGFIVSSGGSQSAASLQLQLSNPASEKARILELERQVKRLTTEREILKKAMAYCVDLPK